MSLLILAIGITWGLCGQWGYRTAKNWWLESFDYTRSDRAFFLSLSLLGPVFLLAIWAVRATYWNQERTRGKDILEKKR